MREKILQFIADRYGWDNEELLHANSFEELGLDSLSLYSLVTDVEEEFGISIETDDMTELDSPEKFITYVIKCDNK